MSSPSRLAEVGALGEQVGGADSAKLTSSSTKRWTRLRSDSAEPTKLEIQDGADGSTCCTDGARAREATKLAKAHQRQRRPPPHTNLHWSETTAS
ncbi:unnamed protein product [Phytophthora fragariaefolia]|uniref:Unnamed protein product n=1 Tax=Phytophthora fragariaefolia TaxID=1490495 RepID=A0A9W7D600_9STRA|nr:unnamed protein product [Phytophthora fragariaefolia]